MKEKPRGSCNDGRLKERVGENGWMHA